MSAIVQTFVEPDFTVDLYADGDAIITKDTHFFQISAELLRSLVQKSRRLSETAAPIATVDVVPNSGQDPEGAARRVATAPGSISRQVQKTDIGWQAKFLDGREIVTYFYESRSLARTGELSDAIGQNGRVA